MHPPMTHSRVPASSPMRGAASLLACALVSSVGCGGDVTEAPVGDDEVDESAGDSDSTDESTSETSEETETSDESETADETETSDETEGCPTGTESCPCDAGSCEAGLVCEAGLCIPGPLCGNGAVEPGEACDEGPANDDQGLCKTDCTVQTCGDGFVGPREGCDDGNQINEDGCTNVCALPTCGDGILHPGEACDDGNAEDSDACLTSCVSASCGDAVVWAGVEGCDDGENGVDTDACLSGCVAASCGDTLVWAGVEGCDDGNDVDLDGCNLDCKITGELVWEQVWGDPEPGVCDYFHGVDVGPGGVVVAVGSHDKLAIPTHDCELIVRAYSSTGEPLWSAEIAGPGGACDQAWGVDIDADGNAYVAGHIYDPVEANHDQWVGKFSPAGELVWSNVLGRANDDFGYGLAIDGLARVVVVGSRQDPDLDYDLAIRWLTAEGEPITDTQIEGEGAAYALDVHTRGDATYVTGFVSVAGQSQDIWLGRYGLDGELIWSRTHDAPQHGIDRGGGVAVDEQGRVSVAGFVTGPANHDIWIRQWNGQGDELWTQTWDDPQLAWADRAQDVAVDPSGYVIAAGQHWTPGVNQNGFDGWLGKYDPQGQLIRLDHLVGAGDGEDVYFAVDTDVDGSIVAAGASTTSPGGCTDAIVRKYNP